MYLCISPKRCILRQLKWAHGNWTMSLISIWHKCVLKQSQRLQDIPDHFETQEMSNKAVKEDHFSLHVPDQYKMQEMCEKTVEKNSWGLDDVPDRLKTQGMCNEAVRREPCALDYVPDCLRTQEMYNEIMYKNLGEFFLIPDRFKTQEVCAKVVEVGPWQISATRQLKKIHIYWGMFLIGS